MSFTLHLLDVVNTIAAVTPSPSPTDTGPALAPAAPMKIKVGEVGQWFGPAIVLVIAIGIDFSAAGDAAKRDRIAAVFTYCSALGFISIYRWSEAIQGWFDDSWSWALTGSALAVIAHVLFVAILIGDASKRTKRVSAKLGPLVGIASKESNAVGKFNTRLHIAAVITAATCVLARGDSAWIPHTIGRVLCGASALVVNWVIDRLGG
ncbi:MAG: hypothetical protein QG597_4002 [Actinomycetota bacterium]|nr:hypothetical protein [Actinomycetota bacterium]